MCNGMNSLNPMRCSNVLQVPTGNALLVLIAFHFVRSRILTRAAPLRLDLTIAPRPRPD